MAPPGRLLAPGTYPGSKVLDRDHDAAGRLTSTTDWAGRTATFVYDDDSNWTNTAFGTANTDRYTYDAAGRMLSATWGTGTGTPAVGCTPSTATCLGSEVYTRPTATKGMVDTTATAGAAGAPTPARDNSYDNRDRLTSTGTGREGFALDAASNLTKGPGGRNQQFNLAQELCWSSAVTATVAATLASCPTAKTHASQELYTYDSLGRRLTTSYEDNVVRTHTYDQASRLTKVSEVTGSASPTLESMDGVPIVGNLDGDGEDDVFFYRSTSTANDDYVFWGGARNQFGSLNANYSVGSGYTPASGDFNCDGRDDIMWYKPGSGSDYVWFWFGRYDTSDPSDPYISKAFTITDSFVPVTGDFNGDDCADILWYAAGSANDAIWWGASNVAVGTNQFPLGAATVGGSFAPVAGDFDGNGADDVFWYAPGTAQDYLWTFNATGGGYTSTPYSVNTSGYDLATGDVDGNGRDDLLFSNPARTDNLWWGQAAVAGFGSSNQKPLTIGSGVTPVMGDFDGDGKTDLVLYKGAVTGDDMWWGAAPADFSTAAGGTGLQHLTPTHQTTYTYDADGIRASKKTDAGPTQKFTYSSGIGLPVLLTQQSGTDTTYLVYGPGGQPIEQINPDGTAQWLHHDQLGSVRLATRAADGTETSRRTFNAYGTVADQAITSGDCRVCRRRSRGPRGRRPPLRVSGARPSNAPSHVRSVRPPVVEQPPSVRCMAGARGSGGGSPRAAVDGELAMGGRDKIGDGGPGGRCWNLVAWPAGFEDGGHDKSCGGLGRGLG